MSWCKTESFGSISAAWMLALILGLTGASCVTQVRSQRAVSSDLQSPTPDPRLLTATEPDVAIKAKVQAVYGKLPLHFEANQPP